MVVKFPPIVIQKMHNLMSHSLNQAEVIPAHRVVAEAHGATVLIHTQGLPQMLAVTQDKIRVALTEAKSEKWVDAEWGKNGEVGGTTRAVGRHRGRRKETRGRRSRPEVKGRPEKWSEERPVRQMRVGGEMRRVNQPKKRGERGGEGKHSLLTELARAKDDDKRGNRQPFCFNVSL